jgi:signal transduction histidine kinase
LITANRTILYVDDDRTNRIVFEHSFNAKFPIICASSGQEALEILEKQPVAVLISDQRMPGMSGNELLAKAMQLYPDVVRIVITAYSDFEPILRAVNDGIVARYIIKPWDRAELEALLDWAVEAHGVGKHSTALQVRLMQTERLVTLGSIAGAILHDLGGPLSFVDTNTTRLGELAAATTALNALLHRHGAELSDADRTALLSLAGEMPELVEEMQHGFALIRNITGSMRRLLKSAPAGEPDRVDPVAMIRPCMSICKSAAIAAGADVLYDGPPSLPEVTITATELSQVIINLVTNAVQSFSGRRPDGNRVVIHAAEEGDRVRITVADNGPGMTPEVLQKIGTLFFTTKTEGTGLGVSQCRRLIQKYKGELNIDSTVGQGTTATLWLHKAPAG